MRRRILDEFNYDDLRLMLDVRMYALMMTRLSLIAMYDTPFVFP